MFGFDPVYVTAFLAALGGILAAFLNWLNGHEDFAPRKFLSSLIMAVVSGWTFGLTYDKAPAVTPFVVLTCLLWGVGFDAVKNLTLGTVKPLREIVHGGDNS